MVPVSSKGVIVVQEDQNVLVYIDGIGAMRLQHTCPAQRASQFLNIAIGLFLKYQLIS
jgi:hypothetical protein